MKLSRIKIKNHRVLGNVSLNLINPKTHEPYSIVAFVGENGCGKTTLLNELFNYEKSESIIEKEQSYGVSGEKGFQALFLRQNTWYIESLNDISKQISGGPAYSSKSELSPGHQNVLDLRSNAPANTAAMADPILDRLGDERMKEFFLSNKINNVTLGGEVTKQISGVDSESMLQSFSSGQWETMLKLRTLKNLSLGVDMVLLDEPETSLHPKWQSLIVDLIASMIKPEAAEAPQLFVATHSERVLESLIKKGDALIVQLFREKGKIHAKPIDLMDLRLPSVSFAELDYLIFGMISYDYHDQLLNRFGDLIGTENLKRIDRKIKKFDQYKCRAVAKDWEKKNDPPYTYKTLPVYIRNWFHHPSKEHVEPTEDELTRSIVFLRDAIRLKMNEKA